MARQPRLFYPGAFYHILLRGEDGQKVFNNKADYQYCLGLMEEGVERYGHKIHAFCCMPDHIHLLIQVNDVSLSRIMQNLSFRYTRWANQQRGREGHVFHGRYKAILFDPKAYLSDLTRYLHNNPLRAKASRKLDAYRWSSHRAYLGVDDLPWLTTNTLLEKFGKTPAQARKQYAKFIEEGKDEGFRRELVSGVKEGRLLGNKRFIDSVYQRAAKKKDQASKFQKITLARVVADVCGEYGIKEKELSAAGKNRTGSQARAIVAYLVRELPHLTLTDASTRLKRDVTTLSASVNRLLTRLEEDAELQKRLNRLKRRYRL